MCSLFGRRTIDWPGVGGTEMDSASRPRTVRVPVAYVRVNSMPCAPSRSRLGVSPERLPYDARKSADMLSMLTSTTLRRFSGRPLTMSRVMSCGSSDTKRASGVASSRRSARAACAGGTVR